MEENELFLKFFSGLIALILIGTFTYGILVNRQEHQEKMLVIQKCPCMEVQK